MLQSDPKSSSHWVIEAPSPLSLKLLLLVFFVASGLVFLKTKPVIFMDEAIYADTVSRFNQGLGLSTPLFRDYIPWVEQYSYWYPPVYFLLLAPVFLVFGSSLVAGRLLSLALGVLVLLMMNRLAKRTLRLPHAALGVLVLLVTDFYFQDASTLTRMEILSIFWGLIALLTHLNWIKTKVNSWAFLTGLFAVLSLLTHPTGAILVAPLGLSLLLFPKLKLKQRLVALVCFGAPLCLGLCLWVLSFWPNLDIFVLQNQLQLHRKDYGIYFVLESLRYKPLHRIILAIYSLSNLWFLVKGMITKGYLKPKTQLLMFLAFTSLVLTILMKEMWYVVYLPLIGALLFMKNLEWFWQKKFYWPVIFLPFLLLVNVVVYFERIAQITSYKQSYESFSQKVAEYLPENAKVLLSSMPDPYFYFRKQRPDLDLRETPNSQPLEPIDVAVYNKILTDVDYVIFSFLANDHLSQYFQKNLHSVLYQGKVENGDYGVMVIKLKPSQDRLPLEVEPHLQWQYPKLGSFKK